jgi:hypothetical protein
MSSLGTSSEPLAIASPLAVEECPLCDLTDAVACPACNGTGTYVLRVDAPASLHP